MLTIKCPKIMKKIMEPLKIGDLVAKIPIIQGGMGVGISLSKLSSAVAKEGGIGVIATPGIGSEEEDFKTNFIEANNRALANEIKKVRNVTDGILGVNIMVGLNNYNELVKTAFKESIDIIFSGAGLPLDLPKYRTNDKTKLVPIVSSARAAKIIASKWMKTYNYLPDAFVVEGPLAGGHLGFKPEQLDDPEYCLENLLQQVLETIKPFEEKYQKKIPIIVAGGIFTGKDIFKFMQLGASGVQMATRFVATHECDASLAFKEAYVEAKQEDLIIIQSPLGLPGRVIRKKFVDDITAGKKKPFKCPFHCLITCKFKETLYCIADALLNAKYGVWDKGFAFAGFNAYRIKKIVSVKELISSLVKEYNIALGLSIPKSSVL